MFALVLQWLLATLMVTAGVLHFVVPKGFERIVPKALPAPRALVYVSGVFEILGGVGLLVPATQRWAAYGLIALFVAVFPANINQAVNQIPLGRKKLPRWVPWARLPLQLVLIWWAWQYARPT